MAVVVDLKGSDWTESAEVFVQHVHVVDTWRDTFSHKHVASTLCLF